MVGSILVVAAPALGSKAHPLYNYNPDTKKLSSYTNTNYEIFKSFRVLSDGKFYSPMSDPTGGIKILYVNPDHSIGKIEAGRTKSGHDDAIYRHDGLLFTSGSTKSNPVRTALRSAGMQAAVILDGHGHRGTGDCVKDLFIRSGER